MTMFIKMYKLAEWKYSQEKGLNGNEVSSCPAYSIRTDNSF